MQNDFLPPGNLSRELRNSAENVMALRGNAPGSEPSRSISEGEGMLNSLLPSDTARGSHRHWEPDSALLTGESLKSTDRAGPTFSAYKGFLSARRRQRNKAIRCNSMIPRHYPSWVQRKAVRPAGRPKPLVLLALRAWSPDRSSSVFGPFAPVFGGSATNVAPNPELLHRPPAPSEPRLVAAKARSPPGAPVRYRTLDKVPTGARRSVRSPDHRQRFPERRPGWVPSWRARRKTARSASRR